jgi:membrane protein implicated in regulation of membrane protease activity
MVLIDVEAISPHRQWIPVQIVFLAVLLIPVAAVWQLSSGKPTVLFVVLAPLVGVFLVAFYYAFDVYGTPPYYRTPRPGTCPRWPSTSPVPGRSEPAC